MAKKLKGKERQLVEVHGELNNLKQEKKQIEIATHQADSILDKVAKEVEDMKAKSEEKLKNTIFVSSFKDELVQKVTNTLKDDPDEYTLVVLGDPIRAQIISAYVHSLIHDSEEKKMEEFLADDKNRNRAVATAQFVQGAIDNYFDREGSRYPSNKEGWFKPYQLKQAFDYVGKKMTNKDAEQMVQSLGEFGYMSVCNFEEPFGKMYRVSVTAKDKLKSLESRELVAKINIKEMELLLEDLASERLLLEEAVKEEELAKPDGEVKVVIADSVPSGLKEEVEKKTKTKVIKMKTGDSNTAKGNGKIKEGKEVAADGVNREEILNEEHPDLRKHDDQEGDVHHDTHPNNRED